MDSFDFRLPEQHPPTEDSFDTRPVALQRWIEDLPMGHVGESAKQLYTMLREVNRLDIPLVDRFELLEAVYLPLHSVLQSLKRHYTGMPFPLPEKSLRVVQVSSGLLHEMVLGYQAVLDGEENASWFFRMTHTRMWLEAVHRLVYYLHGMVDNYRLIHRMVPGGVWQALHRLYWLAREHGRHQERVRVAQGEEYTTIEGEYLWALLLSLLEPQLLSREQMAQVVANRALWQSQCELVAVEGEEASPSLYCIHREADTPLLHFSEDCGGEQQGVLLFDIGGLGLHLAALLEQMGDAEQLTPKGGSAISREALETLHSCWHQEAGRQDRQQSDGAVEVAIGMSGLFKLLQQSLDPTARGIGDQQMSDNLEELRLQGDQEVSATQNRGTVLGKRNDADVWGTIFSATAFTQKSWSRDVEEHDYHFIPAQLSNYTRSGYGLWFNKQGLEPFQIGELLGVRGSDEEAINLCMVRWLLDGDSRVQVGLMRLAESIEPALVIAHQEERRTALYSLLGIGRDGQPQLFLPHLPGIRGKRLYLVVDGKEVPLELLARVVVSPLFDAFHFHVAFLEGGDEMSLQQINRQLHAITHPSQKERLPAGDFSDLWNTL